MQLAKVITVFGCTFECERERKRQRKADREAYSMSVFLFLRIGYGDIFSSFLNPFETLYSLVVLTLEITVAHASRVLHSSLSLCLQY